MNSHCAKDERYIAEWIERQHIDAVGEWVPDRDELGRAFFPGGSYEEASAFAMKMARKHEISWARVLLQKQNPRFRNVWDTVRKWTGDENVLEEVSN